MTVKTLDHCLALSLALALALSLSLVQLALGQMKQNLFYCCRELGIFCLANPSTDCHEEDHGLNQDSEGEMEELNRARAPGT